MTDEDSKIGGKAQEAESTSEERCVETAERESIPEKKLAGVPEEGVKKKPERKKTSRIRVSRKRVDQLREKAKKADEYFDQMLRLRAEFENYRKRTNREREEFAKYAAEELICEFLTVVDHLENAISSSGKSEDYRALVEGVEMTRKEAVRILSRWGLEEVKALGEKFDPERHEAIEHIDCDEEEDKIVEELRKGYSLKGKLIRPSMVKVARRSKNG